ncbi:SpoIIIAH-like family protein [Thermicanus aegyptius]|uniref:SpoIIIAH-like family protein n=1 Tax=Thermicanus aegyptius TaxID=94009 RepID=UPI0003FBA988|nr:SpoIIIAH-like family protein [Thermicanus aegyptius]
MSLKKQTVWLLTMLTLMVVLSAYYLFYGEVKPIDVANPDTQTEKGKTDGDGGTKPNEEVGATGMNDPSGMGITPDPTSGIQIETAPSTSTEDFFASLRLERDQARAQMMEQYYNIVSANQDKEQVKEASAKLDELQNMESNEQTVESLIKAEGFPDAVVIASREKVNVIVQAKELKEDQVVTIINLVSKNMNVPGTSVIVSSRQ